MTATLKSIVILGFLTILAMLASDIARNVSDCGAFLCVEVWK